MTQAMITRRGGGAKINGAVETLPVSADKIVAVGDFLALRMAATVGSTTTVYTTSGNYDGGSNWAGSVYGNTLFVAFREVISSVYYVTVKAINIGITTPAVIASVSFTMTYGYGTGLSLYAISETDCIVSYIPNSGSTSTFKRLFISGSTFNTIVTTTSTYGGGLYTLYVAPGKYAICSSVGVVIVNFTESAITFGPTYLSGTSSTIRRPVDYIEDNKLAFVQNLSTTLSACVLTVGASITVGTATTITYTLAGGGSGISVQMASATEMVVATSNGDSLVFTVSGTTVTAPPFPHYAYIGGGANCSDMLKLTSGKFAAIGTTGIVPFMVKACYACLTAAGAAFAGKAYYKHSNNRAITFALSGTNLTVTVATVTETVEPSGVSVAPYGIAKTGGSAGETVSVYVPA